MPSSLRCSLRFGVDGDAGCTAGARRLRGGGAAAAARGRATALLLWRRLSGRAALLRRLVVLVVRVNVDVTSICNVTPVLKRADDAVELGVQRRVVERRQVGGDT